MKIHEHLTQIFTTENDKLIKELAAETRVVDYKKSEMVLRIGEKKREMLILISGIVEGFLHGQDGKMITDSFNYKYGQPIITGMELNGEAIVNLKARTDVTLLVVNLDVFDDLVPKYQELSKVHFSLMNSLKRYWDLKLVLQTYDAKGRYEWFLKKYPGLIDVIPHAEVASFLNMTPVTLSRIRGQMRKDKK